MASRAIEFRLQEAERQLAALEASALTVQADTARLKEKIDAIRRSLADERTEAGASAPPAPVPPVPPVTPPPLPPRPVPSPKLKLKRELERPPASTPPSPAKPVPPPPTPVAPPEPEPEPEREPLPSILSSDVPVTPSEGLELQFGRVWFARIGIGLLLTGFVFFSTYAYQTYIIHWAAGFRILALYGAAVLLTLAGIFLERWKDSLLNYGRVVTAGGWAAIYYTTYAAHHIEHLRVIESPVTTAVLLSLVALAFFAYAATKKSSILTVGALALAFYATAINPMGWLGCFSGFLLSAIGMFFFLRFRWLNTGIASLLGAYLSYAYWHGFVNPEAVADPTRWFLVGYWLLFVAGVLAPQSRRNNRDFLVGFATANNALFFFLFSFQFHRLAWVSELWLNALVFGAVLLGIAIFLGRRRDFPRLLAEVFLAKGLALVTWGLSLELTGHSLFLTLTFEALVLAVIWRRTKSPVLRAFVWIPSALAGAIALGTLSSFADSAPLMAYVVEGILFVALALLIRGAPWIANVTGRFSFEATAASFLALLIPTVALTERLSTPELGLWMTGIGVAMWLAYLLRPNRWPLPELVWLAQGYAALGALLTLLIAPSLLQLGLLAALGAIAFQAHGLAGDGKRPTPHRTASLSFEIAFTIIFIATLALWIHRGISDPGQRLLLFAILPFAGHLYGSFFSRRPVMALSQLFYIPTFALSALSWAPASFYESPSQSVALAALLLVLGHLVAVHLVPLLKDREIFRDTHLVIASLLWVGWCASFLSPWWLVLAWTGCALAFLPVRFRSNLLPATVLTFLTIALVGVCLFEFEQFWLRYLALPAIFLVHLVQSRHLDDEAAKRPLLAAFATALVVALAIIVSQHTLATFDGKGLSICWALLGLALFGLGLSVKVRVYRFGGLALLALSLGHVLVVDVWKLETILRFVSFFTLGFVLLALGFVYNRWHEQLRRLL